MQYKFLLKAKQATYKLANFDTNSKNQLLLDIADALLENSDLILSANKKDMQNAKDNHLDKISLDRLFLNENSVKDIVYSIKLIASLKDPVHKIIKEWINQDNIKIQQVSIPIGIIGIIYESRPSVTAYVPILCLKSGNVSLLKGGKEAKYSNKAIVEIMQKILKRHNLPKETITLLNNSKQEIKNLIKQDDFIDLIIPRGSKELNNFIVKNSSIPVLKHGSGLCHIYIHKEADINRALEISFNAKCHYPGVCNAMETLLIDKQIANKILPKLHQVYLKSQITLKGCEKTSTIIEVQNATQEDFDTEHLSNILNIKIVNNIDDAILHIRKYSSNHSESIITQNLDTANYFMDRVDSSCVYHNASTKFTEGNTFGFGAEVGISTNKIHARGPVGLEQLTTYKYKMYGDGQIKAEWFGKFGYKGVFLILLIGSIFTLVPFDMLILPIGFIMHQQGFSLLNTIILSNTLFLSISIIGFFLAKKYPNNFMKKISNFLLISRGKLKKIENFFTSHSNISLKINKSIKGLEQFNSLPSALLQLPQFGQILLLVFSTTLWTSTLSFLGFIISKYISQYDDMLI